MVGRNVRIRDMSKTMLMSLREINSDFFRRAMIHIIRIREMGVMIDPEKRAEDQPIAVAMSSLSKEETDSFRRRCQAYVSKITPLMDLATIICIIFPVLLIVLAIVGSMMPAGSSIPLPGLKIMVGLAFPMMTFMLIYVLTRGEPK
jgi:predicted RNA-binding protein Jag